MIITIPPQIKDLMFCKVYNDSKRPVGEAWQLNPYTAEQIIDWLSLGNTNYGLIAGYKSLLTIDFDDPKFYEQIAKLLPDTFTVKSPNRGFHAHYLCRDISPLKAVTDKYFGLEKDGKHYGEVRFFQVQTIGPGSIHKDKKLPYEIYNNVPLAEIKAVDILKVFEGYYKEKIHSQYTGDINPAAAELIIKAASGMALNKFNSNLIGAHPIHGSDTGQNFSVSPAKGVWHCFRHGTGGGALSLVAVREGVIKCEEARPGGLHGEKFKQTIKIAKEKYGIDFDDPKNGLNFIISKSGKVSSCLNNVLNYLDREPEIRDMFQLNEFTGNVEFSRPNTINPNAKAGDELNDFDLINLRVYFSTALKLEIESTIVWNAIVSVATRHKTHPVKNYIQSTVWDGVHRLDTWLINYAGVEDTPYTRSVSRIVLLAAVARIYHPGCKFDYLLILEGPQGLKKSTLIETLGGKWFHDVNIFLNRDKDTVDAMRGAWIIEVAELAHFKKADIEGVKAFITRKVDRVRMAYNRLTQNFPRQCIFIGTINPDDNGYLTDETGNRRFWPVACNFIDIEGLSLVRDQLFAEAYSVVKSGDFKLYMDEDLEPKAVIQQAMREVIEVWGDPIGKWLMSKPTDEGVGVVEIAKEALGIEVDKLGWHERRRIATAMRQLGWAVRQTWDGVTNVKKYYQLTIAKNKEIPWE